MPLQRPDLGFMNMFSQTIEALERRNPYALTDIRRGEMIFIASDYSGEHDLARYQTLSFLFADLQHCYTWENKRIQFRNRYLADGRRIAFKNLRDKKSREALPYLLDAANTILGLSITFLIDKQIESLFREEGAIDRTEPKLEEYLHWPQGSFEKMLRVVHLISFFLAGLSRKYQDVMWITDQDEIAANEARLRELTNITAEISSHYLPHTLRHLRCGTTKSDNGSRQLEDLASIPDLIAGALSEVLGVYRDEGVGLQKPLIIRPPENLSNKSIEILNWFATDIETLKRLVFSIEPVEGSSTLTLKQIRFHGSNDFIR